MRILVDGDACPSKEDIVVIAKKYHLPMIVFIDYAHVLNDDDYEVRNVSIGRDSVDMAIVQEVKQNDLVITQDYGLAGLVLSKKAKVLHVSGMIIDEDNINELLLRRYASSKLRKAKQHLKGPKKRKQEVKDYFMEQLERIVKENA